MTIKREDIDSGQADFSDVATGQTHQRDSDAELHLVMNTCQDRNL